MPCAARSRSSGRRPKRNAGARAEHRLDFRIGINLGDVIVEGDDIHGDGVNIADRLQALAEPGGIAISGTAYDHVKTKLPVGYARSASSRSRTSPSRSGISRAARSRCCRQDDRAPKRTVALVALARRQAALVRGSCGAALWHG